MMKKFTLILMMLIFSIGLAMPTYAVETISANVVEYVEVVDDCCKQNISERAGMPMCCLNMNVQIVENRHPIHNELGDIVGWITVEIKRCISCGITHRW